MNKMMIIGNLTRDPELRTTPQGVSVCDFTVAVNRKREGTDYFRVTAWRQLGDLCQKYLAQGRKVYVSGALSAKTYQTKNGETKVDLGITAEGVEFLSGKEDKPVVNAPSTFMQVDAGDEMPF